MITDAFNSVEEIERHMEARKRQLINGVYATLADERQRLIRRYQAATVHTPILDEVLKQYPNDIKRPNKSMTGRIPMRTFERIEGDLRREMRLRGLRVWYYGTRKANPRSATTRRDEATHVMIYPK